MRKKLNILLTCNHIFWLAISICLKQPLQFALWLLAIPLNPYVLALLHRYFSTKSEREDYENADYFVADSGELIEVTDDI